MDFKVGDIFQVISTTGQGTPQSLYGALIIATEIKSWGIQGCVPTMLNRREQVYAVIRIEWDHIVHVGHTDMPILHNPLWVIPQ